MTGMTQSIPDAALLRLSSTTTPLTPLTTPRGALTPGGRTVCGDACEVAHARVTAVVLAARGVVPLHPDPLPLLPLRARPISTPSELSAGLVDGD